MLPKNLFQILITDKSVDQVSILESAERNISSLKTTYPDANYHRYDDRELLEFISGNFPSEVLLAYRALRPYAFKADLARYCLLFKFGGLYSDLSYLHLRPIDPSEDTEIVVFRDAPIHPSWAVSNAVIYAKAGCNVLERAINRVILHHKEQFCGISPLEVTGPYMFGRVLAETENWRSVRFGDSNLLNTDSTGRINIVKIMPTGEVVAIRNKTRNSEITDLVASGGNNYCELWEKGQVWETERPISLLEKLRLKL